MLPIFKDNSKIPVYLSYLAPINIFAISLGIVVFCRETLSTEGRIHETIHYRQWLELAFVGFLILYPLFFIINLVKGMNGEEAYRQSPFEREAYDNQSDLGYLFRRPGFAWIKYFKD